MNTNTGISYVRTACAVLIFTLALTVVPADYTAFAQETTRCDKAEALLAKLQRREKGFTNEKVK